MSITGDITDALLDTNVFGDMIETVFYTPEGGERVEINAHVFRNNQDINAVRGARTAVAGVEIFIARSDVPNVTINRDTVEVYRDQTTDRAATDLEKKYVKQVISVDSSGYRLKVL